MSPAGPTSAGSFWARSKCASADASVCHSAAPSGGHRLYLITTHVRQFCTMLKGDHSYQRRQEIENMNKPNKGPNSPYQRDGWWRRNWFYAALILIAIIGSLCAFYLPLHISEPFSAGDSVAALRQAILAATGGVLAMLTLGKTDAKICKKKIKTTLTMPGKSRPNVVAATPKQLNNSRMIKPPSAVEVYTP